MITRTSSNDVGFRGVKYDEDNQILYALEGRIFGVCTGGRAYSIDVSNIGSPAYTSLEIDTVHTYFSESSITNSRGFEVDFSTGIMYHSDEYSTCDCIFRYDINGDNLGMWGTTGSGDNQFDHPRGLYLYDDLRLLVADMSNERIVYANPDWTT